MKMFLEKISIWLSRLSRLLVGKYFPPPWQYIIQSIEVLFTSVQFSHSVVSDSLRSHEPQHTRPPCPSPTPGVYPNPCPLSRWCHPTISSSVIPFSSCPQSFPASGSFLFFSIYFILFFNFTILYWFCHISTLIHHRYTRVPHPEPSNKSALRIRWPKYWSFSFNISPSNEYPGPE